MPKSDVLRLTAWCADKGIRLLVDESFVDFTYGYAANSLLHNDILAANPHMMVIKSYDKYEKDYAKACDRFIAERETFYAELQAIPYLRVIPSQANYFLCEVTKKYTSAELVQKLIERNVMVSDCGLKSNMNGRNLVRLAIRSREDNERLVGILRTL